MFIFETSYRKEDRKWSRIHWASSQIKALTKELRLMPKLIIFNKEKIKSDNHLSCLKLIFFPSPITQQKPVTNIETTVFKPSQMENLE